jgi:hypothetical protein
VKRLLLLVLLLAGCRQAPIATNPQINIQPEWGIALPVVGETTLRVLVSDPAGQPIDNAVVEVRGDMNHAGMQPELYTISRPTNGAYETPFTWTMAGDWFVEITVTLPDGSQTRQTFNYTVASR